MVFTLAIVFASKRQAATPVHGHGLLIGALLGLAVALAIAYVIFKLGRRLNLGLFFRVIGIVLMVFAAGLLADAVENMQQLGWLPLLKQPLWDSSRVLSESSSLGDVFHSLLGYADHPTVLQAVVWVVYIVTATTAFIVLGRRRRRASEAGVPTVPTTTTAPVPTTAPTAPAPASTTTAPAAPAVSAGPDTSSTAPV